MVNPDFYLGTFEEARVFHVQFERKIRDFLSFLCLGAYFYGVNQESVSKYLAASYDDISSSLRQYDARYRFDMHRKSCDALASQLKEAELL